mmetsp:Transcript_36110/g.35079  ORF Transcript_36110/g.35079 Transcript_36110/m.35079 type:complete len:83 (+) Transcript_36110:1303-1551(+)
MKEEILGHKFLFGYDVNGGVKQSKKDFNPIEYQHCLEESVKNNQYREEFKQKIEKQNFKIQGYTKNQNVIHSRCFSMPEEVQ